METLSLQQSKVWVVAPTHARKLLTNLSPDDRKEWCYLGSNVSMSERVAKDLGRTSRIFIGDELVKIAGEIKRPFIDWVAKIGRQQKDKVNWWASRLASKSPLQTDFFLLVCYSRLAHDWICAPTDLRSRIVVVEDPWLRWVIRRQFENDPRVRFLGGSLGPCLARSAYWLARTPVCKWLMLLSSVCSLIASRLLFPREAGSAQDSRNPAVLIYTWIDRQGVTGQGKIQDAHTGRLEEILLSKGEKVLRLTPLDLRSRLLWKAKNVSPAPILTARYTHFSDILRSSCSWFRIKDLGRLALFQGWDYRPLFYRELLFEWGSTSYPRYHLWYRAMLRVASKSGRKVKCLIYPFENQPWEKLMCLAWREKARHVQLIGYQHSRVPPLLLPYALSKKEAGMLPLPDRIVTNSEATLESLRAAGFPDSKLVNGGALRYEYFYSAKENSSDSPAALEPGVEKKPSTVLVTFPLSRPHCKSLLLDLLDVFQEPLFLDDQERMPVRLLLKCHPWLPLEMFYRGKMNLSPWMSFTEEPLERELTRAELLLYVPSTTSWREAYVAGIPVLKYEVDLLDIDPPESFNAFSVHPCRKETLRPSIQRLLKEPRAMKKPSPEVLEKIFGRVDEELWLSICAA